MYIRKIIDGLAYRWYNYLQSYKISNSSIIFSYTNEAQLKGYRTTFLLILITVMLTSKFSGADNVRIYCDGATPPTEFTDANGNLTGLSVEIVREIQGRIGDTSTIEVRPWARAYLEALTQPDVLLFTTSRNKEREKQFHWIFHVTTRWNFLFAKRGSRLKINSLEDAKKVRRIGVLRNGNREKYLKEAGFTNLENVTSHRQNLKKLITGRVDLIFMSGLEAAALAKDIGIPVTELEPVYKVYSNDSYIVLSKNGTELDTVKKWAEAAQSIKADGTFKKIGNKWVGYTSKNYGIAPILKNNVFYFFND